jgi:putative ABC transport system ATP-binding protein
MKINAILKHDHYRISKQRCPFLPCFCLFLRENRMEKGFLGGKNTGTFHHGFRSLLAASASALTGRRIYNRSVESEASSQIILAENLVKVYEAGKLWVTAVRGVSLSVHKGEFVAVVGPSGSGKSTLFYLLGGLTRATEGRVVIDGIDFATLDDGQRTRLRKHRIGFVFQKFNLLPTLSAMGNIEIPYTISGRKEPMDLKYLDQLCDMLSIRGRLKHRPAELSGGEQQRVAIARALVARPAIVLADEPTGNLDTKNSDAVLQMLMRSNRELGQTTLMITHNPEAASVASRILYMRDGQIVREEKGSHSGDVLSASTASLPS